MKHSFSAIYVSTIILIFVGTGCGIKLRPVNAPDPKLVEEKIEADEKLKQLDTLCLELPKPHDYEFIGRTVGTHSKFVSYRFRTSLKYDELKSFFDPYFRENGWQFYDERPNWGAWFKYTKKGDYISVTRFRDNTASVLCKDGE